MKKNKVLKGRVAPKAVRSNKPAKATTQKSFASDIYPVWQTRDGREIRVDEMSTNHLLNTLAHINKRTRMHLEAMEKLQNYWAAMDAVLAQRNVWVRPGEEPIAPVTDYISRPTQHDPFGYIRWAMNEPIP